MKTYSNLNPNNYFDGETIRNMIRDIINETIVEGLVKTYPLNVIDKFLVSNGYVDDVDYSCDYIKNNFIIRYVVDENTKQKYYSIVNKLQNLYGWVHGSTQTLSTKLKHNNKLLSNKTDFMNSDNYGNVFILYFEPKFDIETDLKEKYYHLTPKYNLNNILNIGLKPKMRNDEFSYGNESRIYLLDNIDDSKIKQLITSLYWLNKKKQSLVKDNRTDLDFKEYYLLEINTSNLKDLTVHIDTNYNGGYYITENIPPQIIKPIFKYLISPNGGGNIIKTKI